MEFSLNLPVNPVSFGQVSTAILKEIKGRGLTPPLVSIGPVDLSSQEQDEEFINWIRLCLSKFNREHRRKNPIIKLWHMNGGMESFSERQILVSFYELDNPTPAELNIVKNNHKTLFTSKYTCDVFSSYGCDNVGYLPLGFDSSNFKRTEKQYFSDGRITFNLVGKFEKRKHHSKILAAWAKRFGNDRKYALQCSVYNTFLKPEHNHSLFVGSLNNQKYFNINSIGFMAQNKVYNDFLNSGDIIVGMSGGEGWGLPEFQSVALGKHSVILDCNGYKSWANEKNSVLVRPTSKTPAYDGIFFHPNQEFNQGNIFDFNEDQFINACETAIKRVESNKINEEGIKLQSDFTYAKTVDALLEQVRLCQ